MARPPKPVSLKDGHMTKKEKELRKQAEDKLKGNNSNIKCPEWLDDYAKDVFYWLIDEMSAMDILTNLDIFALSNLSLAVSRMKQSTEILNKEGLLVEFTNKAGATNIEKHKALAVYNESAAIFKQMLAEFPLSPSARAKLAIANIKKEEDDADPFVQMFGSVNF